MTNNDSCCDNCSSHNHKGQCKQAMNTKIDYSKNNNPFCWHWSRSLKSLIKNAFTK